MPSKNPTAPSIAARRTKRGRPPRDEESAKFIMRFRATAAEVREIDERSFRAQHETVSDYLRACARLPVPARVVRVELPAAIDRRHAGAVARCLRLLEIIEQRTRTSPHAAEISAELSRCVEALR